MFTDWILKIKTKVGLNKINSYSMFIELSFRESKLKIK